MPRWIVRGGGGGGGGGGVVVLCIRDTLQALRPC